jgi:hypothetical protein
MVLMVRVGQPLTLRMTWVKATACRMRFRMIGGKEGPPDSSVSCVCGTMREERWFASCLAFIGASQSVRHVLLLTCIMKAWKTECFEEHA